MKKSLLSLAALLISAMSFAAITEYTLTLTPDSITKGTGSGYAAYNATRTETAYATSGEGTYDVTFVTENVMASTYTVTDVGTFNVIQLKASAVKFYNTTNLGKIKSITLNQAQESIPLNAKYIIGATENPTEAAENGAYFSIQPNGGTGRIGSIVIVFEKSDEVIAVTGIELSKSTLNLEVGETATLTATVLPLDAANKEYTWSTSKEEVATIKDGLVTAVGAGEATITATTTDGNKTATCTITVVAPTKSDFALTTLKNIKEDDDVIIVYKNSAEELYALKYTAGANTTPVAVKVRDVEGTLKGYDEDNMLFTLSYDMEKKGYIFSVTTEDETYSLYTTDNNNNVRVSKPTSAGYNTWVLRDGYLRTTYQWHKDEVLNDDGTVKTPAKDYYRYLGVYNNTDFRAYDGTAGNIKEQTALFYVRDNGGEPIPTAIENNAVEVKAVKFFRNGQLVIVRDGIEYNVLGAQL